MVDKDKYIKNILKIWKFKSADKMIRYFEDLLANKSTPQEIKDLNITEEDIQKYFDKYHLSKSIKKFDKSLMGNKFSAIKDAWQMDIYFIGKLAFLLLVHINTKYAWIKRMDGKSAEDVIEALQHFIPEYHPKVIECDEDSAFLDYRTLKYLQSENIILKTTPKKYKDYLSVIDKVCKTINAHVYGEEIINDDDKRVEESNSDEFKMPETDDSAEYAKEFVVPEDYDENEAIDTDVESIVDRYNKTYNYALKMTPEQMWKDENSQLKWIYKQFKIRDAKDKMNLKRKLKVGDKVRYILDRDREEKKFSKKNKKHEFSKYYYKINRIITPYLYEIIARDGTVKPVPRYRLYKLNYVGNIKWSKSISKEAKGEPQFFIDKILDYEYTDKDMKSKPQIKNCFYTVRKVQIQDKARPIIIKEKMSVYQLRQRFNIITTLTKLEMDFLENHSDDWKYDSKRKLIVPAQG